MSGATTATGGLKPVPILTPDKNAWLSRVLGLAVASAVGQSAASGPSPAGPSLVALQKSRLAWDSTRKSVLTQLKSIEAAIVNYVTKHNENPDTEDEYDLAEIQANKHKLYQLLERYDERLIDKLDAALNAQGEQRALLNKEAADVIREYQGFLGNDDELSRIDKSGFVASTVRPVIEKTLAVLSKML